MKTTIYTANPKTHFFKELKEIFQDMKNSQFLAKQMAKRDLYAQYRQSLLGFGWAIAPILNMAVVWIFINESGVVKFNGIEIPYPLFVIIGLTLWNIFTDCVNGPINTLNISKGVISKINFPKEALIVSGIYKVLFNAVPKMLLMILFMVVYGVNPNWSEILWIPFYLFAFIIMGTAIGVLIAPIGLLYTDVSKALVMIFGVLMYMTPVVFPAPKQRFALLFEYNPLTPLITSTRNILTGYEAYDIGVLVPVILISFMLLCIGLVIFRNSMNIIIEKIS